MNTDSNSYEPRYAAQDAPKIKTVSLQLGVTGRNLEAQIRKAFTLAKSAGHELDLTFGSGHSRPSARRQLHPQ